MWLFPHMTKVTCLHSHNFMKLLHCFTKDLKNKLLQNGYRLITESNGLSIFENSPSIKFNFNEVDKKQFIFSDKMTF